MPVTAKLSRKFYERFGDDLTNELVTWMNAVDATYRTELRDLFEVQFGRFNALLEQRVARLDAKVDHRATQLDAKLERRAAEARSELREEMGALRQALGLQRGDVLHGLEQLRTEIASSRVEILRWNFLFWVGTLGTVVALLKL